MAEKNPPRADAESLDTKEALRKKRIKWAAYAAAFVVFQTIVILVFVMVVMRVRTPKFRIGEGVSIRSMDTGNQSLRSFDLAFEAPIRIKNNNFGPYKYDAATLNFTYEGVVVGQAAIPKGTAGFMGTKKLDVNVTVTSAPLANPLGFTREIDSGVLTVNGRGRLSGKAEIMLIFKKKKATDMNCTMVFNVTAQAIKSVECK